MKDVNLMVRDEDEIQNKMERLVSYKYRRFCD